MSGRSKSRRRKAEARRIASRERAHLLLQAVAAGDIDAYEGYRALFGVYCSNSAALEMIKPLFRMDGVDPDGVFSVTDDFRSDVVALAQDLLPLIPK
jgi:hypothetical protein